MASARGDVVRPSLEAALRLLDQDRFDELAEVLATLERERAAVGETVDAALLGAVAELCLACITHRRQAESHREVESRLRERLVSLITMASAERRRGPVVAPSCRPPSRREGEAGFRVLCLGPLQVYRDGVCLGPWPNRRARSVFEYLVVHRRRPVPKEILMERFWPDAPAAAARNNLNVAIHALRRHLQAGAAGERHVLFRHDCYQLNPATPTWVDVEEFDGRVAAARRAERAAGSVDALEAAVSLYRGPLFEDEPYQDWSADLRRTLHDAYVEVLERLCDLHLAALDHPACVTAGRRLLAVEPAHEKATACSCSATPGRGSTTSCSASTGAAMGFDPLPQARHEMTLRPGPEADTEQWDCPVCCRVMLVRWAPDFEYGILRVGDERAIHAGGKGIAWDDPAA